MVKDMNSQKLLEGVAVRRKWAEYFEQVLNVEDVREANINVAGDSRMPVMGGLNKRTMSVEEVREAVTEMKSGKASGLNGFPVECLKKVGTAVLEWLVRLLDASSDFGVVPIDWRGAFSAQLYINARVTSVNVVTREVFVC